MTVEQALEQIEDLSLKVVVGGAAIPEALEILALIENVSREARRAPAADIARDLAQKASSAEPSEVEGILSGGLDRLRQALEGAPAAPSSLAQDPELIADFVNESAEHLASVESQVLALERDPSAADALNAAFRSFHTIKGLAGFLELDDIREVSHNVETLLDRARNHEIAVTPALIDVILEGADYLKRAIAWVASTISGSTISGAAARGAAPETSDVLAKIGQVIAAHPASGAEPAIGGDAAPEAFGESSPASVDSPKPDVPNSPQAKTRRVKTAKAKAPNADASPSWVPEPSLVPRPAVAPTPSSIADGDAAVPERVAAATQAQASANAPRNPIASKGAGKDASRTATKTASNGAADTSAELSPFAVRVDATKLDYMMDMVGELVIAQSLLAHAPELAGTTGLQRHMQQLGRITGEVQRVAMSLRMTPLHQLYARMTRLVRDLSRKCGKRVRLELSGEETELDKTIIEQLGDPLMHMVRNSLDHGIETPDERLARGKPAEGVLRLAASHQAGYIVIEISDDGRGLNPEKILRKARERGLVPEGHNPGENEIYRLIFEPGFSTAEQVTEVSGRGVGMDVVRKHIQGLRGRIEIRSTPGRGATFFLKLPLTLAIIDGLIVRVGGERYILPISSVREMLRPAPEMLFTMENRAEMAMIRGDLLPIVRLDRRFRIPNAAQNPCEGLFVVTESEGRCFCLLVDAMIGKQEVVIKSLGETFRHVSGISGGAILGDGRVGLILDANGILREHAVA